jgi:hypothetical protein
MALNQKIFIKMQRLFATFLMPMLVLAIRIMVENIFKNSYPSFFKNPLYEKIAIKLINDQITALIDPNLFYSRFSFFESGREAINIKCQVSCNQY